MIEIYDCVSIMPMQPQKAINFDFSLPPALGEGISEVAEMKFGAEFHFRNLLGGDWLNAPRVVWKWRIAVVAIAAAIMLMLADMGKVNAALGLVLFFAFALSGVASATSKGDQRATAYAQRIVASVEGAIRAAIELSLASISVLRFTPVCFTKFERRASPPPKIKQPTLYPRLVATPWPACA